MTTDTDTRGKVKLKHFAVFEDLVLYWSLRNPEPLFDI